MKSDEILKIATQETIENLMESLNKASIFKQPEEADVDRCLLQARIFLSSRLHRDGIDIPPDAIEINMPNKVLCSHMKVDVKITPPGTES